MRLACSTKYYMLGLSCNLTGFLRRIRVDDDARCVGVMPVSSRFRAYFVALIRLYAACGPPDHVVAYYREGPFFFPSKTGQTGRCDSVYVPRMLCNLGRRIWSPSGVCSANGKSLSLTKSL